MLKKFMDEYNKADQVVFHNGDKFDLPWIFTRCILHGIEFYPNVATIDTLKRARKFKFNSNKLDYLSKFLGFGAKTDTKYSMWVDILMKNDKDVLKQMVDYCKNDVVILEKLHNVLDKYFEPKTHVGIILDKKKTSCAHCASEDTFVSKTRVSAAGTISKCMKCKSCNKYFTISGAGLKELKGAS